MSRTEMGTIKEGYEAFLITEGFEHKYEINGDGVSNTYDTLEEFAEQVLLLINPMGYYRLKIIASDLLEMVEDKDKVVEKLGLRDDEVEFIS